MCDSRYKLSLGEKNNKCFNKTIAKRFLDQHFANDIIDNRVLYIKNRIDEAVDNEAIKKELLNFYYDNTCSELFIELNSLNKKDNLVLFMDIILDSDSYYEMNNKINILKKAIHIYETGQMEQSLTLVKDIDSDKHKEVINDQIVCYPRNSINKIDKPKKIIDRMKNLYSRIDDNFDVEVLDSIHEDASSLTDLCNKINYYRLSKKFKRKVKSLFK